MNKLKKSIVAVLLAFTLIGAGCSTTAINTIKTYVEKAATVIDNMVPYFTKAISAVEYSLVYVEEYFPNSKDVIETLIKPSITAAKTATGVLDSTIDLYKSGNATEAEVTAKAADVTSILTGIYSLIGQIKGLSS